MAHYAHIVDGVVDVVIVAEQEYIDTLPDASSWVQTSYNTRNGVHMLGGTPLRKNYAGIGFTYDAQRDAFIPPKPYQSWVLNEDTCDWECPVPYPQDGKRYAWNDDLAQWDVFVPKQPYPSWPFDESVGAWRPPVPYPCDGQRHKWDEGSTSWVLITD